LGDRRRGGGTEVDGVRLGSFHREQCAAQGVAFLFKQWGGVRKDLAGRVLDGRTYDEFPGSDFGRYVN
jgi:protein gp37